MFDDFVVEDTNEKSGRILLVDDEPAVLQALKRLLYRQYEVVTAEGGEAALQILEDEEFDLIISDMRMPGMTGDVLLKTCYERYPDMVRVLLTGYSDIESTIKAVNEGNIFRYVNKPWDNQELRGIIADALQTAVLKDANQRLQARIVDRSERRAGTLEQGAVESG